MGSLKASDDTKLFYQCWRAESPKALVVISHGYAEHSSRYKEFASYLVENGFSVYALDYRGHGKSEGERANISVFRELVDDLHRFIHLVREKQPNLKRFLLGHSMGGVVASQLLLEHPYKVDALILSSPFLQNAVAVPAALNAVSGVVGRYLPSLPTLRLDTSHISRDKDRVDAYVNDPLVYTGGTKARMGVELRDAGPYVLDRAKSLKLPCLVMHGDGDQIASVDGSRLFIEQIESEDKTLNIYDGAYHELLNEINREEVYKDVLAWLEKRV